MESQEPINEKEGNLLKMIGVPAPSARNQNLAMQSQRTDMGNNNQIVPENMINLGASHDKVLTDILRTQRINQGLENRILK